MKTCPICEIGTLTEASFKEPCIVDGESVEMEFFGHVCNHCNCEVWTGTDREKNREKSYTRNR